MEHYKFKEALPVWEHKYPKSSWVKGLSKDEILAVAV